MNSIWRRIVSSVLALLVMFSLSAAPAQADPTDPPIWPPVNNNVILVSPDADDTQAPSVPTTLSD